MAVTLLCLSSMGGAMVVAFRVLVPLHWLAGRGSSPVAVGGWALLSALSVLEGVRMLSYLASRSARLGLVLGLIASVGVASLFLLRAADRAASRPVGA